MNGRLPDGYWTKEKILEVALLCETKTEMLEKYASASTIAMRNGWWLEVTAHIKGYQPRGTYTLSAVLQKAQEYKNATEMNADKLNGGRRHYCAAQRHGWLKDLKAAYAA
jgi:hypothetical protein